MPTEPTKIPGPTQGSPQIALARLGVVTADPDTVSDWVDVHFNPASLQLQLSNELKSTRNQQRSQYIAKTTAKLTLDLQFDTTDTGEDVTRAKTKKLQAFIAPTPPPGQSEARQTPPPTVLFEWGALKFKGIAEGYKETIDFFSADGVPLRAQVNLTLSRQDKVFDEPAPVGNPGANAVSALTSSPSALASQGGDPNAARGIAAANNEESLRFSTGASLTVGGGVTLKPPSGFASVGGGPGLSLGGGASLGIGGGAGISGLARVSATEGAFAGLRANVSVSTPRLEPSRLLSPVRGAGLVTGGGASFSTGGRASLEGGAGLNTNVGASTSMKAILQFDPT